MLKLGWSCQLRRVTKGPMSHLFLVWCQVKPLEEKRASFAINISLKQKRSKMRFFSKEISALMAYIFRHIVFVDIFCTLSTLFCCVWCFHDLGQCFFCDIEEKQTGFKCTRSRETVRDAYLASNNSDVGRPLLTQQIYFSVSKIEQK